jgi:hypothetical protein
VQSDLVVGRKDDPITSRRGHIALRPLRIAYGSEFTIGDKHVDFAPIDTSDPA